MIRRVRAQARVELVLTLRRGESLLVAIGIPVGILFFFSTVDFSPLRFLVPGVLALAVISMAMVSLGIATGFERQSGMLKRLGATPLGRGGLLAAKMLAVLGVEAIQVVAIVGAGLALGWRCGASAGDAAWAVGVVLVGTAAFAGLGFLLAGNVRAEANLAVTNGLFLVLLMLGGIVVPLSRLPGPLRAIARTLPAEPLASSLRALLAGGPPPGRSVVTLGAWALGTCALAAATFKWE